MCFDVPGLWSTIMRLHTTLRTVYMYIVTTLGYRYYSSLEAWLWDSFFCTHYCFLSIHLFPFCCLQKQQDNAPAVHISNSGFNTPLKGYQTTSTYQVTYLVLEGFFFLPWKILIVWLRSLTLQFSGQYSMGVLKGIDKSVLDYLQQPQCLYDMKGLLYSSTPAENHIILQVQISDITMRKKLAKS